MFARDVMTAPVFFVSPHETIAYARNLMVKHKISRLLVMEEGRLTGILTKKDIAYHIRQGEPSWRRRPVDQIPVGAFTTANPIVVAPDTGIKKITGIFAGKNISSVPVVEAGTVVGIVTKTDLMKSALVRNLTCPVEDIMEDVATVSRYHSLDHVITLMSERHDKVVVLNNDGTIAGIITETNLAFFDNDKKITGVVKKDVTIGRRERADGMSGQSLRSVGSVVAEDVMTSPVITVPIKTLLPDALELMRKNHVNSLVVIENDTISGIIKRDDIIKEVAK
ncbi:MAG TPA: CBS domain-containing protein [Methanoregula sp.]|nr:CBS domain-containing protein [Methanoregula sp.]